jgi:hypothetical protein
MGKEKDGTMVVLKHPAKQYPGLFSTLDPEVAVTYIWSMGLDEEKGLLSLAKGRDENLRIWLDVLFIDQLSTNIPMNLACMDCPLSTGCLEHQHYLRGGGVYSNCAFAPTKTRVL